MSENLNQDSKAFFHLPGLFEFYDFYRVFLPVFFENRDFFYDWCTISSIYGSPYDCLWGGGRVENGETAPEDVLSLLKSYGISARLTFSNSLLNSSHLEDKKCNELCRLFQTPEKSNGIILHSDILLHYLQKTWPGFYFVSSTTKVLTDFPDFYREIQKDDFSFVVPDFRLNKSFDSLKELNQSQKNKVEFLCNECCDFNCKTRKLCYENVSRKNLGLDCNDFPCSGKGGQKGYVFSMAMKNPGFIGTEDIKNIYLPMGFSNFKIEGRGLGNALLLEFILFYMTKPQYHLQLREKIYLDSMLDLF